METKQKIKNRIRTRKSRLKKKIGNEEDFLFLNSSEGLITEENVYDGNDICEECYEQPETCGRTPEDKFLCWVGVE
jgi:hypothetical protein